VAGANAVAELATSWGSPVTARRQGLGRRERGRAARPSFPEKGRRDKGRRGAGEKEEESRRHEGFRKGRVRPEDEHHGAGVKRKGGWSQGSRRERCEQEHNSMRCTSAE